MKAQQNPGGVVKPDFYFFCPGGHFGAKMAPGQIKIWLHYT